MLQQSSEQIVSSGANGCVGTVIESKDIRQIGLSDTICLCGKGAAGALASGSFIHGTSTHGVSRFNAQIVSDNGHELLKGGCFVEAPGSVAVSCLGFRFLDFVRKVDRHKPRWIQ